MKKTAKLLIMLVLVCIVVSLLVACGGATSYKIEFIVDGEVYHTEHISGNDVIPFPKTAPQKTDHIFMGWYADDGVWEDAVVSTRYFDSPIKADLKVYARFIEDIQHVHDYVSHDAKEPTCTEIGWNEYDTCSRCDYTTYVEIEALGHDYINHEAQEPTCTEIGWYEYDTCSRCDYTTYVEIEALGHDRTHHLAKEPTCTEIGWNEYDTCSRCDYTTYVEIEALGHDYHKTQVDATCEEKGYTLCTCSCGDNYKENEVPALGHDYTNYVSDSNATYESDGTKTAECNNGCGKTDTIPDEGSMLPSSIEFSDSLSKTGVNAYGLRVRSAVDEIDFTQYVTEEGDSSYTVASDEYATTSYPEKIAPLSFGDNVFYIFSNVKGVSTTYTLTIYRNKIFTVTFETDGGSEIEHQSIEEGYCASEPAVEPEKAWHEFLGWDYDFNTPITDETIITAQWEALREIVTLLVATEEDRGWIEEVIAKYNMENNQYAIVLEAGTIAEFERKVVGNDDTVSDLCYGATSNLAEYHIAKDYFVELSDVYNSPFNDDYTIAEAMIDYVRNDSYDIGSNWAKGYFDIRAEMVTTSLIVNKTLVNYYEGLPMWGLTKKLSEVTTIVELNAWIDRIETLSESYPYTYVDSSGSGIVSGYAYNAHTGDYFEALWQTMWAQYSGVDKYREFFEYDLDYDMYDDIGRQYAYQGIKDIDLISREIDGAVAMDYDQAIDAFLSGKTAVMIGGSDVYARAKDKLSQYGSEIEMIYLPTINGGTYSNLLYCDTGDGFVIPNVEGVNAEGAKDFLKYLFRVEIYEPSP